MQVILELRDGAADRRQCLVRSGQAARFGRTEWADYSFPHDPRMADVHFEIDCVAGHCEYRGLTGAEPASVNGKPVERAVLRDGDQIQAGGSTFLVRILDADGLGGAPGLRETTEAAPASDELAAECPPAEPLAKLAGLPAAALEAWREGQPADEFLAALRAQGQLAAAVKFLAQWLPKDQAVAWACVCRERAVGEERSSGEHRASEAARLWAAEPDDEKRRNAMQIAQELKYHGGAAWLAAAAGWSGGSMAPPDLPDVAPQPHLTGKMAAAVVLEAASRAPSGGINEQLQAFLDAGVALLATPSALANPTGE